MARLLGQQILDFYVYTDPYPTIIRVQGEHWHKNDMEELRKKQKIEQYFNRQVKVIDLVASEIISVSAAIALLKKENL